ncbi:MAG: secondary thiamine-phosphate synthase enzyme YjbQ [Leptospiraceae bacterium]|nr:secondary thiamine-phosphate synthase enzyme YjbQ [Leptospiraceae bacterium]MDW7976297.1 secondary thiamine-phosphate synthase enzyme YjbQ [Leptospiraceae bacterium]
MIITKTIRLKPKSYGIHIITNEVIDSAKEIAQVKKGICFLNLLHTSAAITINENASPEVRTDFKSFLQKLVPRNFPFTHSIEGDDDMPAHILSSLIGTQLQIPIENGRLVLGTWQGIYLCEFRDGTHSRNLQITIIGE